MAESQRIKAEKLKQKWSMFERTQRRRKEAAKHTPEMVAAAETFIHVMEKLKTAATNDSSKPFDIEHAFNLLDRRGRGSISRDEFFEAMKAIGITLRAEEVTRCFLVLDPNGDGDVNGSEFSLDIPQQKKVEAWQHKSFTGILCGAGVSEALAAY